MLRPILAITATAALLLHAPLAMAAGCADAGISDCGPATPGWVNVMDFDDMPGSPGVINTNELQCAIDCLDADTEPDHALPLSGQPEIVPGGIIRFSAGLRYELWGGVRLPWASTGPIHILGEGAVIRMLEARIGLPFSVLSRTLPASANACDAAWLADNSAGWTIEGLTFMTTAQVPTSTCGVILHGARHVTLRRCTFVGFPIGVELHDCEGALLENCIFTDSRIHDTVLSDSTRAAGSPGTPAYSQTCSGGPSYFSSSTVGMRSEADSSGSTLARMTDCTHARTIMPGAAFNIVQNSSAVVIEGATVTGSHRPNPFALTNWDDESDLESTFAIRDSVVTTPATTLVGPLLENDGIRLFMIENLEVIPVVAGSVPSLLYDTSGANKATTTVFRNVRLPGPLAINGLSMAGRTHAFSFFGCDAGASPLVATTWLGGVVPSRLSLVGAHDWRLPELPDTVRPVHGLLGLRRFPAGAGTTELDYAVAITDSPGSTTWHRLAHQP